ncbi:MAG: RimK/LysX family protein [Aestuariivirga sp.]
MSLTRALRLTSPLLPMIGWKEDICLPELDPGKLVAKIDTGARISALHAEDISVIGRLVSFRFAGKDHEVKLIGAKRIKSSNGHTQIRPMIETEIVLGHHRFKVAITLTDRGDMGVPMLLGREAIKGRFLVNAARIFMLGHRRFLK